MGSFLAQKEGSFLAQTHFWLKKVHLPRTDVALAHLCDLARTSILLLLGVEGALCTLMHFDTLMRWLKC